MLLQSHLEHRAKFDRLVDPRTVCSWFSCPDAQSLASTTAIRLRDRGYSRVLQSKQQVWLEFGSEMASPSSYQRGALQIPITCKQTSKRTHEH
jgi:hypothetical protein